MVSWAQYMHTWSTPYLWSTLSISACLIQYTANLCEEMDKNWKLIWFWQSIKPFQTSAKHGKPTGQTLISIDSSCPEQPVLRSFLALVTLNLARLRMCAVRRKMATWWSVHVIWTFLWFASTLVKRTLRKSYNSWRNPPSTSGAKLFLLGEVCAGHMIDFEQGFLPLSSNEAWTSADFMWQVGSAAEFVEISAIIHKVFFLTSVPWRSNWNISPIHFNPLYCRVFSRPTKRRVGILVACSATAVAAAPTQLNTRKECQLIIDLSPGPLFGDVYAICFACQSVGNLQINRNGSHASRKWFALRTW